MINIKPLQNELPSSFSQRVGESYSLITSKEVKKEKGQFFTPKNTANIMANLCTSTDCREIKILDPGCGLAILSSALIENLILQNPSLKKVSLDLYELDNDVVPYTEQVLTYLSKYLKNKEIELEYRLIQDNFILKNSLYLSDLFKKEIYDIAISNPPFYKLGKDDPMTKAAALVIGGQPNIYFIFLAIIASMLKTNGEMITIHPRSFTSGKYYKRFRSYFLNKVVISNITTFDSRRKVFKDDKILQEVIVMRSYKSLNKDLTSIEITNIDCDTNKKVTHKLQYSSFVDLRSKELILHIPTSKNDYKVVENVQAQNETLNTLGFNVSTGPVVSFRSKEFTKDNYVNGCVPLIWLNNVSQMKLVWPLEELKKPQYIMSLPESKNLLLPNKNYVLIRRMSSRDDSARLIAAPVLSTNINCDLIGLENKLNYIYKPEGELTILEALGIAAILNSKLMNNYFQIINGSINVSATELKELKLPDYKSIIKIGDIAKNNSADLEKEINKLYNT